MKINDISNLTKNVIKKKIVEARYSYKGRKIRRISDGLKGKITAEVAFGKAYQIEWENGKTQTLGRSTITNKNRYIISAS